jgi:hypothetical protein
VEIGLCPHSRIYPRTAALLYKLNTRNVDGMLIVDAQSI